MALRRAEPLKP